MNTGRIDTCRRFRPGRRHTSLYYPAPRGTYRRRAGLARARRPACVAAAGDRGRQQTGKMGDGVLCTATALLLLPVVTLGARVGAAAAVPSSPSVVSGSSSSSWAQDELAIGFFLDPEPTLANYQLAAAANFTLMVGTTPKNTSEMALQAELCGRTGLKCILGGPPHLSGDACHGSAGNVDPQALPPPSSSVWGYYLQDEPQQQAFPSVKAQQDRLHAAHPGSLVFLNVGPPGHWFGPGSATPAAEAEYIRYLDEVEPDLLSFDCCTLCAMPFYRSGVYVRMCYGAFS